MCFATEGVSKSWRGWLKVFLMFVTGVFSVGVQFYHEFC